MSVLITGATLGCGLGAHHWVATMNDHHDYYEVCEGCGKQGAWMPLWPEVAFGRLHRA